MRQIMFFPSAIAIITAMAILRGKNRRKHRIVNRKGRRKNFEGCQPNAGGLFYEPAFLVQEKESAFTMIIVMKPNAPIEERNKIIAGLEA